jgi:hypothetical protein
MKVLSSRTMASTNYWLRGRICLFGDGGVSSKTPQHQQKLQEKGELLLNTFVFFHIAEKVLSFSSLSPAFVFC